MIQKDYSFGNYIVDCDKNDCSESITGDDFMEAIDNARNEGWILKKVENNWYHFCSKDCEKESLL